jgi:hypothetical protein
MQNRSGLSQVQQGSAPQRDSGWRAVRGPVAALKTTNCRRSFSEFNARRARQLGMGFWKKQ